MKKILLLAGQSLLGLILLWLFLRSFNWQQTAHYFSHISVSLTVYGIVIYYLSTLFRIWRFELLLRPIKRIHFFDSMTTTFAGSLLNYLLPIRAGEVGRAWFLRKKYHTSLVSVTTVSFIDKIFEVFAILILFFVLLPVLRIHIFQAVSWVQFLFIFLFVVIIYFLVFKGRALVLFFEGYCRFLPSFLSKRIVNVLQKFIDGFSVLRIRPSIFFLLLLLSVLSIVCDGIYIFFLFWSLGTLEPLTLSILGYALFSLSFIIPAGPGYVGNLEFLGVLVFSRFMGIPSALSASMILDHHLLVTLILAVPGFVSLGILQWKKKQ
jgi:uncharacterized protein (TIRG00374 family)